jgi:hypothetical protein
MPSAYLLLDPGKELCFYDHGVKKGLRTYGLPQLAYAQMFGKPPEKGKEGSTLILLAVRLLVGAGTLPFPPLTDFPPCPEDASESVRKVYDGFRCVWGLKQLVVEWRGKPTEFARDFAAHWCGVTPITAHRARQRLTEQGVLSIVGKHRGRTCVYLPGCHRAHQGNPGRSQEELDRIRRNELRCVRRVAALVGYDGPELTWETKLSDRLLDLAARVRRSWKVTSVERSIVGSWVWDRPKS